MGQAEKARKKFQSRIPFVHNPGKKIPKKIAKKFEKLKTSFRHYFQPKQDEIGQESGKKKILDPNSVPTQPKLENSRKNSKKIQKIKKPFSGIIFSQNEMGQTEKARKKFQSRIPFLHDPGMKIPKKFGKKFKKLKTSFRHSFQLKRDEMGQEREKKILVPNSIPTQPEIENSRKNSTKIQKIKKPFSGNISSQNWMRLAGKGRKIFQARIPLKIGRAHV